MSVLVVSDHIATMHGGRMSYEPGGVLVDGARISAVLTPAEVAQVCAARTAHVVDVTPHPVLPGLVDAHVHLAAFAEAVGRAVDCHSPPCRTVSHILQTLHENRHVAERTGGWLIGQGSLFQDRRLAEGRLPTRGELDSVDRELPIVFRPGGHTLVMNTPALMRAMNNPRFAALPAALLERDARGTVTGVVREVELGVGMMPVPEPDATEKRSLLRSAVEEHFTARGVTSVADMSSSLDDLYALDELIAADDIAVRCTSYPIVPRACSLEAGLRLRSTTSFTAPPDRLAIRGLKLFVDGGISSGLAAIHQRYTYKRTRGRMNLRREQLTRLLRGASEAGLDLAFHTMGERAQDLLADAAREVRSSTAIRVRAEHAGTFVTREETFRRWRDGGILPVPNATFIYTLADFIAPSIDVAAARLRVLPLRTMAAQGWTLPGASDATGSEIQHANPFFGVKCAVGRQSYTGATVDRDESVSVEDALYAYTAGSAAICGELADKGTLETGKFADLVVLDRDPLLTPVAELDSIRAVLVMVGGRIVLDNQGESHGDRTVPVLPGARADGERGRALRAAARAGKAG